MELCTAFIAAAIVSLVMLSERTTATASLIPSQYAFATDGLSSSQVRWREVGRAYDAVRGLESSRSMRMW